MEVVRHWRLNAQRYRLVGSECQECGEKSFPSRDICPECIELKLIFQEFDLQKQTEPIEEIDSVR